MPNCSNSEMPPIAYFRDSTKNTSAAKDPAAIRNNSLARNWAKDSALSPVRSDPAAADRTYQDLRFVRMVVRMVDESNVRCAPRRVFNASGLICVREIDRPNPNVFYVWRSRARAMNLSRSFGQYAPSAPTAKFAIDFARSPTTRYSGSCVPCCSEMGNHGAVIARVRS